jgi:hypothetical protein
MPSTALVVVVAAGLCGCAATDRVYVPLQRNPGAAACVERCRAAAESFDCLRGCPGAKVSEEECNPYDQPPTAMCLQQPMPAERLGPAGEATRRRGQWITGLGVAAIVAGAVLVPLGPLSCLDCNPSDPADKAGLRRGDAMLGAGAAALVLGHVGVILGPVLWSVGAGQVDRARKLGYRPAAAQPFVAPTPGGVVTGVRLITF